MFEHYRKKHPDIQFRYLRLADYELGIFDLLSQLTKAPICERENFQEFINLMQASNSTHLNIVGIDCKNNKIVAFGSIIACNTVFGRVGKIENIVTCKSVRGKGYGRVIIQLLKDIGWLHQCRKITLFCEQKNVEFYKKLGFKLEGSMYSAYK